MLESPVFHRKDGGTAELTVPILSNPTVLAVWAVIVTVSLGVLWWDLRERNQVMGSMMKFVWGRR